MPKSARVWNLDQRIVRAGKERNAWPAVDYVQKKNKNKYTKRYLALNIE